MPNLRLLPIVLFASASLFVLKAVALLADGGYVVGALNGARAQESVAAAPSQPAKSNPAPERSSAENAKRLWAQDRRGDPDITGSAGPAKPAPAAAKPDDQKPAAKPGEQKPAEGDKAEKKEQTPGQVPGPDRIGTPGPVPLDGKGSLTEGQRVVLESLQERRQQLEARGRELDIREGLVKAAEKKLESRLDELKALEKQVGAASQKKDDAENARFKGLITMYENMKAKDAARIFDRLEMKILLDVAGQINPRRMSDILAQMSPEAAERLTVELAGRAASGKSVNPLDLPKIEGKPRT